MATHDVQPPTGRHADMPTLDAIVADVLARFGADAAQSTFRDNRRVVVPARVLHPVLEYLQTEHGFDMLVDMTAVDYLEYPDAVDRFGVVYLLLNTTANERLIVKTFVDLPRAGAADGDRPVARRRLDGARGVRHVRHRRSRAIPTCGGF